MWETVKKRVGVHDVKRRQQQRAEREAAAARVWETVKERTGVPGAAELEKRAAEEEMRRGWTGVPNKERCSYYTSVSGGRHDWVYDGVTSIVEHWIDGPEEMDNWKCSKCGLTLQRPAESNAGPRGGNGPPIAIDILETYGPHPWD